MMSYAHFIFFRETIHVDIVDFQYTLSRALYCIRKIHMQGLCARDLCVALNDSVKWDGARCKMLSVDLSHTARLRNVCTIRRIFSERS